MSALTGNEIVYDGFFQCEPTPAPKTSKTGVTCHPFAKKRGLKPGFTVDAALEAAIEYRDKNNPKEVLYIAVFVRRADGTGARYTGKVASGQVKAEWELRG